MGRLRASELRALLSFIGSASPGTPAEPLPRSTLVALRDVIGADEAEYFELRRADRAVIAVSRSDDVVSAPGSDEAMHAFGAQNPLGWRRWTPAHGAMRMSEQLGRRDLERLDFYQGFMRPNRLRDVLKVWLWSSPESAACVQLWRYETDFTRTQQEMLAVLHQHLIGVREAAIDDRGAVEAGEATLTPREAEILSWVARGASDAEIADRLGTAPATIGKHLENAFSKLGAHSRTDAIGRILFGRPAGRA